MTNRERAEEAFLQIRSLGRMDASMIPVIEHSLDEAERKSLSMQLMRRLAHAEIRDPFGRCVYCLTDDASHFDACLYRMANDEVARVDGMSPL